MIAEPSARHQVAGELQPRVSAMRIALSPIDTSSEPAHPRRVEKKPNITGPRAYWVPYDAAGAGRAPLNRVRGRSQADAGCASDAGIRTCRTVRGRGTNPTAPAAVH